MKTVAHARIVKILLVQLIGLVVIARGKTSNNTLLGPPLVMCGPENIEIQATSSEPFEGVVFIKNWRRIDGCSRGYIATNENKDKTSIHPRHSIPLSDLSSCGMEMKRNTDTKELEVFAVFVFSFHPNFVTFGDRAFAVHCIFRQQHITVATGFDFVSDIAIRKSIGATASMLMPMLSIVPGRVPDQSLPSATTVRVGQPLMFVWHLPVSSGVYGVRVKDCVAETKKGKTVKILEDGCSLDEATISDVTYADDMSKAFADAMAFKFPDSEDMWFKCTIATCIKYKIENHDNADSCTTINKCNSRSRRDLRDQRTQQPISTNTDDSVIEHKLLILDSFNQYPESRRIKHHNDGIRNITRIKTTPNKSVKYGRRVQKWQFCLRKPVFALITSVLLLVYSLTFIAAAVAVVLVWNRRANTKQHHLSSASTLDRATDLQTLWQRRY